MATTSCHDDQILVSDTNLNLKTEQQATDNITYPLSQEFKSSLTKSSSSFETDWENMEEIVPSYGETISLPWRKIAQATIPTEIAQDIKKEDGWTMLLHTLTGQPSDIGRYIVFYNQRTGIMKVFYHSTTDKANNTAKWYLKFDNDQTWLNFSVDMAIPINLGKLKSWSCTNISQNPAKGIALGWNCFQIALAYNPVDVPVQNLNIICESENETSYNFFGDGYSYSNGTILTYGSKEDKTPTNKNSGTIIGSDAIKYIENNVNNQNRGINLDIIKKAAKIVNKLTGLFKGQSSTTKSDLEITTRNDFKVTGTSSTPTTNNSLRVAFTKDKVGELGSWNLSEQPTVYLHPLADYEASLPTSDLGERNYRLRGMTRCDYDLEINPNLKSHLKKHWVEIDFVRYRLKGDDPDEKKAFFPERPDCYTDFGSLGGTSYGFMMVFNQDDFIMGDYWSNKAITNFDLTYLYILLKGPYQLLIGYDAQTVFVPHTYIYGRKHVNIDDVIMRFSLYAVTEFEGKTDTTISTRTFIPKFEWDPDKYNEYKDLFPKWNTGYNNLPEDTLTTRPEAIYIDKEHPEGLPM